MKGLCSQPGVGTSGPSAEGSGPGQVVAVANRKHPRWWACGLTGSEGERSCEWGGGDLREEGCAQEAVALGPRWEQW